MRHAISVMIRRAFFADKIRVGPITGVRCKDSFEGVSTKLHSRRVFTVSPPRCRQFQSYVVVIASKRRCQRNWSTESNLVQSTRKEAHNSHSGLFHYLLIWLKVQMPSAPTYRQSRQEVSNRGFLPVTMTFSPDCVNALPSSTETDKISKSARQFRKPSPRTIPSNRKSKKQRSTLRSFATNHDEDHPYSLGPRRIGRSWSQPGRHLR